MHEQEETNRIQFDHVAWILYERPDGQMEHIYWDEVFAATLTDTVSRIEARAGIDPWPNEASLPDVAMAYAPRCHETIATLLRLHAHDPASWTVRQVTSGPHQDDCEHELPVRFDPHDELLDAIETYFGRCQGHNRWYSPVWEVAIELEPVALIETVTGRAFLPDAARSTYAGPTPSSPCHHACRGPSPQGLRSAKPRTTVNTAIPTGPWQAPTNLSELYDQCDRDLLTMVASVFADVLEP